MKKEELAISAILLICAITEHVMRDVRGKQLQRQCFYSQMTTGPLSGPLHPKGGAEMVGTEVG